MSSSSNLDFNQVESWLLAHPYVLEPGLELYMKQLDLGLKLSVPFYGTDIFGRPCLIIVKPDLDDTVSDYILELVARMQAEGRRFRPLFARPSEPRVFLITSTIPSRMRQRLDLLSCSFSLRTFVVSSPLPGQFKPNMYLEDPPSRSGPTKLLQALSLELSKSINRLTQAVQTMHPDLLMQGHDWPVLLVYKNEPIAALFCEADEMIFVRPDATGFVQIGLNSDESIDLAIDYLLRYQLGQQPVEDL